MTGDKRNFLSGTQCVSQSGHTMELYATEVYTLVLLLISSRERRNKKLNDMAQAPVGKSKFKQSWGDGTASEVLAVLSPHS